MKKWRSFSQARKFARKLKLKNQNRWNDYAVSGKKPKDIPRNPQQCKLYNKDWVSFGDWLGTGYIASQKRKFRSFDEAKKFTHKLGFKNQREWQKFATTEKRPSDIPSNPQHNYKKEWKGYGDWLGTGNVSGREKHKKFRSFTQARKFVRLLDLKKIGDWLDYCKSGKKPNDIPFNPERTYKKEWKGVRDWLGTGRISPKYRDCRSFVNARKFARTLKLTGTKEWREYSSLKKRPDDIPYNPEKTYKNKGWTNWGDFLGTGTVAKQKQAANYLPWPEAKIEYRRLAKQHGIKNRDGWKKFSKTHKKLLEEQNLAAAPWNAYSKQQVKKHRKARRKNKK